MSINMQKILNNPSFNSGYIADQRIVQLDWLTAFWAKAQTKEFCRPRRLYKTVVNHKNFHLRLSQTKMDH